MSALEKQVFSSAMYDMLGFGVAIIEADTHRVVFANARALAMSGHKAEDVVGQFCHHLLCPAEAGHCPITDMGQQVDNSEKKMLLADGGQLPIIKTVVPIVMEGKRYLIESFVDNAVQAKMQEQLRFLAYHDYLTGLPNKLFFLEQLNCALAKAGQGSRLLAIMFLDLDGFKMVNDTMGHATGDQLLIAVAGRLQATLAEKIVIARIGGDEFAVLFDSPEAVTKLEQTADTVLDSFQRPFHLDERDYYITASLGVSLFPEDGEDADTLIKIADIAMYKAKEKGRNQWALCTPELKASLQEWMDLSTALYRAVENGELSVYYQPQVEIGSNRIIGAEALLRWQQADGKFVSPARFIPIAEQTGLIHSLGEWVLYETCRQNRAWQDDGLPALPIAVNLSMLQFNNPRILQQVTDILQTTQLDGRYLELEITESAAMYETQYAIDTLQAFQRLGISIAIDDFGTEYSSLNYLKHLPVDRLKIAMPFIRGLGQNRKDEAIARSIIVLAKSLGLRVIAEGVETCEQLGFLRQEGCNAVQGYYYYKPMTAADMEALLRINVASVLAK